jgi:hypothetical protein
MGIGRVDAHLLAKVVTDLDLVVRLGARGLVARHVDGEMRIHHLHLVLEPLGHTWVRVEDLGFGHPELRF